MANFKLDIDADGIALVTWDMPGTSMNVIDVDGDRGTRRDRRARSRPTPRSRARSSPPARTRSAAAPTSPCWRSMRRDLRRRCSRRKGEEAADQMRVRATAASCRCSTAARDLRQAVGRGAQRHRDGRRLRAGARLPSPHRRRQSEDAARPAGDQGRPVPRRRRHAAHRAHDAAGRRAAIPAQGRPAPARPRQGDEARRRRRAGRPICRRPRRTGSRPAARRSSRGTWTASSCPAARSIRRRA